MARVGLNFEEKLSVSEYLESRLGETGCFWTTTRDVTKNVGLDKYKGIAVSGFLRRCYGRSFRSYKFSVGSQRRRRDLQEYYIRWRK